MDPFTSALSAGGALFSGVADSHAKKSQARNLDAQARLADTQALQRDTHSRSELSKFLSTTNSARAVNGLSAISPNAMKLLSEANRVSNSERLVQSSNDRQRAANLRAGAMSARRGARLSLITGVVNAGVPIAEFHARTKKASI